MVLINQPDQVAWWAHIGGLVAGAVLIVFMRRPGVPLFDRWPSPRLRGRITQAGNACAAAFAPQGRLPKCCPKCRASCPIDTQLSQPYLRISHLRNVAPCRQNRRHKLRRSRERRSQCSTAAPGDRGPCIRWSLLGNESSGRCKARGRLQRQDPRQVRRIGRRARQRQDVDEPLRRDRRRGGGAAEGEGHGHRDRRRLRRSRPNRKRRSARRCPWAPTAAF